MTFLTPNNVESDQILVEADGYVEPLLNNTAVLDIAMDGGNRKWFLQKERAFS